MAAFGLMLLGMGAVYLLVLRSLAFFGGVELEDTKTRNLCLTSQWTVWYVRNRYVYGIAIAAVVKHIFSSLHR